MDKLGLGLDDIIRLNGPGNRRGGKRGGLGTRGGGRGAGNFSGMGNGFRARGGGGIPRTSNPPAFGRWKHDLYDDTTTRARVGQRISTGVNSTTKMLISNLDYGVTTSDVQELFEDIGPIRSARVHYDESGQSVGTAEVVFERRADAISAQQKYHNMNLDGRPMDIRVVGIASGESEQRNNRVTHANGTGNGYQRAGFRNAYQQDGNRGGFNRSRGGKPQANGKKENTTAEDLDADLDAYRAGSAQKK